MIAALYYCGVRRRVPTKSKKKELKEVDKYEHVLASYTMDDSEKEKYCRIFKINISDLLTWQAELKEKFTGE